MSDCWHDKVYRTQAGTGNFVSMWVCAECGAQFFPAAPLLTESRGCRVCGIGADGKPYGYVCNRNDCPTRVTC